MKLSQSEKVQCPDFMDLVMIWIANEAKNLTTCVTYLLKKDSSLRAYINSRNKNIISFIKFTSTLIPVTRTVHIEKAELRDSQT